MWWVGFYFSPQWHFEKKCFRSILLFRYIHISFNVFVIFLILNQTFFWLLQSFASVKLEKHCTDTPIITTISHFEVDNVSPGQEINHQYKRIRNFSVALKFTFLFKLGGLVSFHLFNIWLGQVWNKFAAVLFACCVVRTIRGNQWQVQITHRPVSALFC